MTEEQSCIQNHNLSHLSLKLHAGACTDTSQCKTLEVQQYKKSSVGVHEAHCAA